MFERGPISDRTLTCLPSLDKGVTLPIQKFRPHICEQLTYFSWPMLEVVVKGQKWSFM